MKNCVKLISILLMISLIIAACKQQETKISNVAVNEMRSAVFIDIKWGSGVGELGEYEGRNDAAFMQQFQFYPMSLDQNGNLYILDRENSKILKFNSSGSHIKDISINKRSGTYLKVSAIHVNSKGNILLASQNGSEILVIDGNGKMLKSIDLRSLGQYENACGKPDFTKRDASSNSASAKIKNCFEDVMLRKDLPFLIFDFLVDEKDNIIVNGNGSEVVWLDNNGDFLTRRYLNGYMSTFCMFRDILMINKPDGHCCDKYDSKGTKLKQVFPLPEIIKSNKFRIYGINSNGAMIGVLRENIIQKGKSDPNEYYPIGLYDPGTNKLFLYP